MFGQYAPGAGYFGQSGLSDSVDAEVIDITGTHEPIIYITGAYAGTIDITGTHTPAIQVTGDTNSGD